MRAYEFLCEADTEPEKVVTMRYPFPKIVHLDDVLKAIDGREEFIVADRGDHVIVNYNVGFTDTFPEISDDDPEDEMILKALRREARGIIFDKDTGRVISRRFHKFFNVGERPSTEMRNIDITQPHVILEKLDGCCDGDTKIQTPDGEISIREICEQDYKGLVLGYNHRNNIPEWVSCFSTSISDDHKEWFEIELEDGTMIKLTGNHEVWCENQNQYVRVDQLTIDDECVVI